MMTAMPNVPRTQDASPLLSRAVYADQALLSRVMQYQHPELVERFKDKLRLSQESAQQLFDDVKRFLFVCGTQRSDGGSPTEKIDLGWHEFLLYSRDYREFCLDMFGHFIEHAPRAYFNPTRRPKGQMRTTYLIALSVFGSLSINWDQAAPSHADMHTTSPCDACSNTTCTWVWHS